MLAVGGCTKGELRQRMSHPEWLEWQAYRELYGPFGEERDDWRIASIVWMLASVNSGKDQSFEMSEFLLKFGAGEPQDTVQEKVKNFFGSRKAVGDAGG